MKVPVREPWAVQRGLVKGTETSNRENARTKQSGMK